MDIVKRIDLDEYENKSANKGLPEDIQFISDPDIVKGKKPQGKFFAKPKDFGKVPLKDTTGAPIPKEKLVEKSKMIKDSSESSSSEKVKFVEPPLNPKGKGRIKTREATPMDIRFGLKKSVDNLIDTIGKGMKTGKFEEKPHSVGKPAKAISGLRIPINKMGVPEAHQLKIARDTIKNPLKAKFLGGPSVEESKRIVEDAKRNPAKYRKMEKAETSTESEETRMLRSKACKSVQKAISLMSEQVQKAKTEKGIPKLVGTGGGAALGGALGGPLGAALGGIAGGTVGETFEPKAEKSEKCRKSYSEEDINKAVEIFEDFISNSNNEELKKQWQAAVIPAIGGFIGSKLARKTEKKSLDIEQKAAVEQIDSRVVNKSLPFHGTRGEAEDLWSGKYGPKAEVVKVHVPRERGYLQAPKTGHYYTSRRIAEGEKLQIVPENISKAVAEPIDSKVVKEMTERKPLTDAGGQSEIKNPTTANVSNLQPSEIVKTPEFR